MGLTRAEQETILRWNEEEKVVHVYSASPVTWRKMARLGVRSHKEISFPGGAPSGKFYRLPLEQLRWRLKAKGMSQGNPEALRRAREANQQARRGQTGAGEAP